MRKFFIFVLLCMQSSANSDPKASGPYLQQLTASSVWIQWEAKIQNNATLSYQVRFRDSSLTWSDWVEVFPNQDPLDLY